MPRPGVKVGDRFDDLTVTDIIDPEIDAFDHKRQRVRVRCVCGNHQEMRGRLLRKKSRHRCKACADKDRGQHLLRYKVGQTFDQLTIEGFVKEHFDGRPRRLALCRCSCGQQTKVRPELLPLNKTNSCGCQPGGNWQGIGDLSPQMVNTIKRGAATRGLVFDVGIGFLWNLFVQQEGRCTLTGLTIHFKTRKEAERTASLDRIDSAKGYTENNVQWVHKVANLMKWNLGTNEFVQMCQLIVNRANGAPLPPAAEPAPRHSRGKSSRKT